MAWSESLIEWFKTNTLKKVGVITFVVLIVLAVIYAVLSMGNAAIDRTHGRLFVDSDSGKTYYLTIKVGMATCPAINPDTGKPTLYMPEVCYWNADGTTKTTPTYVILNSALGKPGPTFCPDCGRLVIENNPAPGGGQPPMTKQEFQRRYPGYALTK
jgi:hypothetical protein